MNSYADRINFIVDDLIENKLKLEYFYNKSHENRLKIIPDQLENITKAFKAAFENNSDWRFSLESLERNKPINNPFCKTICNLQAGFKPLNINVCVHNKLKGFLSNPPKGFSLTIAFFAGEVDIISERYFFFKELNGSLKPSGDYLKLILIQANLGLYGAGEEMTSKFARETLEHG